MSSVRACFIDNFLILDCIVWESLTIRQKKPPPGMEVVLEKFSEYYLTIFIKASSPKYLINSLSEAALAFSLGLISKALVR